MVTFNLRPIQDYPDYWVSDQGLIYSTKRGRLMQLKLGHDPKRGRLIITIHGRVGRKTFKVHHLVLLAFGGPRTDEICRHRDDNYMNNKFSNLQWGTQLQNIGDRQRRQRQHKGSSHNSKLSEGDVYLIRDCWLFGTDTIKELAEHFAVCKSTIRSITTRQTWKHI